MTLPPAGKYELDHEPHRGRVRGKHLLTKVRGRFTEFSGTIEVGETPETSRVEVEVKTGSVQTNFEQRDDHLKSADFFEVDEYPTMTFRSTAVRHTGGVELRAGRGPHDQGHHQARDARRVSTWEPGPDPYGNTYFSAEAKTTVEREDWDLTWNMAIETGGLLVGKKVDLVIDVEAKKVG